MRWDDLRYVLAIARGRTLTAAARHLKVNQTTVSRRLKAVEDRLGAALFLRAGVAMQPTDLCQTLIEHADRMEMEVLGFAEKVELGNVKPHGSVRISTMPWIVNYVLLPKINEFRERFPEIEIELLSGIRERNLTRREAEIALRFEIGPRGQEQMFSIGGFPYAIYAPKKSKSAEIPWVQFGEEFSDYAVTRCVDRLVHATDGVAVWANDAGNIYMAVRNGVGKALLPELLGEPDPRLRRISGPEPELVRDLRLLVHPDIRRLTHVSHVIAWLRETVS